MTLLEMSAQYADSAALIRARIRELRAEERLQEDPAAAERGLSHETVTPILKNNIGRLSKGVQYHETCVMPGALVLSPGIAQATN